MGLDIEGFLEITKELEKKGDTEAFEKIKRFFERFHIINRNYLDKETFEKACKSISLIGETIVGTINFIDSEIARLRNKRTRLPFENLVLGEMQKIQRKNERLIKEYIADFQK